MIADGIIAAAHSFYRETGHRLVSVTVDLKTYAALMAELGPKVWVEDHSSVRPGRLYVDGVRVRCA